MALTRASFREFAKDVPITVDGKPLLAETKEFSTGSLGWYANGTIKLKVGDEIVSCTIGLNLTIKHSKDLPV